MNPREACKLKIRYRHEKEANIAAERTARVEGRPMYSYRCPACKRFHVAHRRGDFFQGQPITRGQR